MAPMDTMGDSVARHGQPCGKSWLTVQQEPVGHAVRARGQGMILMGEPWEFLLIT